MTGVVSSRHYGCRAEHVNDAKSEYDYWRDSRTQVLVNAEISHMRISALGRSVGSAAGLGISSRDAESAGAGQRELRILAGHLRSSSRPENLCDLEGSPQFRGSNKGPKLAQFSTFLRGSGL